MTSLIQGILHTRNINLACIAACEELDGPSEASESSKYRRFQRFFSNFNMPLEDVSRLIRRKIPMPKEGYTLSMDRTNWQFGKKHINVQCSYDWDQCWICLHPSHLESPASIYQKREL